MSKEEEEMIFVMAARDINTARIAKSKQLPRFRP